MPVDVDTAVQLLDRGELVAFPTETVYGLGARIDRPEAVARVFERKGRPRFDPLIVHVAEPAAAFATWAPLDPGLRARLRGLIDRFWPGPLTLVAPKAEDVPDLVTAGLPRVAVRQPDHPLALDLLSRVGAPVAAPSANRFGGLSPTTAEAVVEGLGSDLAVLDGGPCRVGVESTVLGVFDDELVLLRPGGISLESIEASTGPIRVPPPDEQQSLSPGRLARHYAPRTPVVWVDDAGPEPGRHPSTGYLAFRAPPAGARGPVEVLSPSGDLNQAAQRLFAALRSLDRDDVERIAAEPVPEEGLGRAIMDRLRRAVAAGALANRPEDGT